MAAALKKLADDDGFQGGCYTQEGNPAGFVMEYGYSLLGQNICR